MAGVAFEIVLITLRSVFAIQLSSKAVLSLLTPNPWPVLTIVGTPIVIASEPTIFPRFLITGEADVPLNEPPELPPASVEFWVSLIKNLKLIIWISS